MSRLNDQRGLHWLDERRRRELGQQDGDEVDTDPDRWPETEREDGEGAYMDPQRRTKIGQQSDDEVEMDPDLTPD